MISSDHSYLLNSVKQWFGKAEQVRHYENETSLGVSYAEASLLQSLQPGGNVLDVGCGAGRVSLLLAELGHQVTAADVCEPLLNVAKSEALSKGLSIKLLLYDGLSMPLPDRQFDAIIAFKLLGYIPTRKLRHQCLLEWYRILKPGGSVLVTQNIVPDDCMDQARDEYFERSPASTFSILETGDTFLLGEGYVRWFTAEELHSELEDTPFLVKRYDSDESFRGSGYIRIAELIKLP